MNNQDLESFALLYHGIPCVKMKKGKDLFLPLSAVVLQQFDKDKIEYIELRSIDSLTEDEIIEAVKHEIVCNHPTSKEIERIKNDINRRGRAFNSNTVDYFRSIGIAVPFKGKTVREIIESCKLKIKP